MPEAIVEGGDHGGAAAAGAAAMRVSAASSGARRRWDMAAELDDAPEVARRRRRSDSRSVTRWQSPRVVTKMGESSNRNDPKPPELFNPRAATMLAGTQASRSDRAYAFIAAGICPSGVALGRSLAPASSPVVATTSAADARRLRLEREKLELEVEKLRLDIANLGPQRRKLKRETSGLGQWLVLGTPITILLAALSLGGGYARYRRDERTAAERRAEDAVAAERQHLIDAVRGGRGVHAKPFRR
jgi:hypothetical protein